MGQGGGFAIVDAAETEDPPMPRALYPVPPGVDYDALGRRLGYATLRRRLAKQRQRWAYHLRQWGGRDPEEAAADTPAHSLLWRLLRWSGLAAAARANCLAVRLVRHRVRLPGLPPAFEGFRLLQISDLHFDLLPELLPVLRTRLAGLEHDAVAVTGDFFFLCATARPTALALYGELRPLLRGPVFAVLGNHDFIEHVPAIEAHGTRVLLNERAEIRRGGDVLHVCGVDDATVFGTHDLARAREGLNEGDFSVLLSHGPNVYREAALRHYQLVLSGHTHGGQICLPGGFPVVRNGRAPWRFCAGPWEWRGTRGYTSRGTGASGLPARFHAPPEVTLHILTAQALKPPPAPRNPPKPLEKPAPAA